MKITVYTTNTCAYCSMVKRYLDAKGKEYKVVNLDDDPEKRQELFERTGAMTVPIIEFDGSNGGPVKTLVGWNPAELAEAINV